MKWKTLLFDLDGTLTDSGEGIVNSASYALQKMGIEENDRKRMAHRFIGPPLVDTFKEWYGCNAEEAEEGLRWYREYFKDKGIFENRVYDGVPEMLAELKESGARMILATSKPTIFAKRILEHFDLISYFDYLSGAELSGERNRKSEVILHAFSEGKIEDLSEVMMIGDRHHDIFGAKETGIVSLGVLYGYGSREELLEAGADYLAADPLEVVKKIKIF